MLIGQAFQRLFVGRRLSGRRFQHDRQFQFVVKQLLQLLGRVQAEMPTRDAVGALLQFQHAPAEFHTLDFEFLHIDQDAGLLHARQHRHQRHFDLAEHGRELWLGLKFRPQRAVQAQGNVGILCCVFRSALHVDLGERNLFRALAGDVLVVNRVDTQILLRQRIHVVAVAARSPHVGFQHRVVAHATHADAIVRQHVHVVLQMLSQFSFFLIFQKWTQGFQHRRPPELRRRAGVVVRQRHIRGATGLDREGNTDDLRAHRIQTRGLAVERNQLGVLQLGQPLVEMRLRQYQFVFAFHRQGGIDIDNLIGDNDRGRRRRRNSGGCRWRFAASQGIQFAQCGVEFIAGIQIPQCRQIRIAHFQFGWLYLECNIGLDGCQLTRQRQLRQRRAQALADLAADLVGVRDDRVERTIFAQPLRGCLRAALFDPWNVVGGVADQREIIDDLIGTHTELCLDAAWIERGVGHGVDQGDVRTDQLRQILVAGGYHDVDAVRGRLQGQRADHIVRFHAVDAQDRKTECGNEREHGLDLRAQIIGHRWAMGFVFSKQLVAEGRSAGVGDKRDEVRFRFQRQTHHVDHTKQGAGRLTGAIGERRQRVESAVQIAGTVNQGKFGSSHEVCTIAGRRA